MKKIIAGLFLLVCFTVQSQENYSFNKQLYLQRSNNQKVTAIALACTGAALLVTRNHMSVGTNNPVVFGPDVFRAIAFGCIGTSIHYFFRSSSNKRTANAGVFVDVQRQPTPVSNGNTDLMPAVGVKVGIR